MQSSLFRDVSMPSHAQDRHAHERFLLDTYAERRAAGPAPGWIRRVLAAIRE